MKDEFFIVLPSNSSMQYYPHNTTTRYTTRLPQCVGLQGRWAVSLAEIHTPMTILHVARGNSIFIWEKSAPPDRPSVVIRRTFGVPSGVYRDINSLLEVLNEVEYVKEHLKFEISRTGYAAVTRICENCVSLVHSFELSPQLNKILGFTQVSGITVQEGAKLIADRPAGLTNAIPDMLYVYTDICESYVTGDVQTPLLRVVPTDATPTNYNYGAVKIKSFSPPRYVPLLRNSFQTIDIDIRDEFGESVAFEGGTLTVTLQFRRID